MKIFGVLFVLFALSSVAESGDGNNHPKNLYVKKIIVEKEELYKFPFLKKISLWNRKQFAK